MAEKTSKVSNNNNNNSNLRYHRRLPQSEVGRTAASSSLSSPSIKSSWLLITILFTAGPSFWLGLQLNVNLTGMAAVQCCPCHSSQEHMLRHEFINNNNNNNNKRDDRDLLQTNVTACQRLLQKCENERREAAAALTGFESQQNKVIPMGKKKNKKNNNDTDEDDDNNTLFDMKQIGKMVAGMAVTSKAGFTQAIDLGVPLDIMDQGSSHVLLLYGHRKTMPDALKTKNDDNRHDFAIEELDFHTAVSKCQSLSVYMMDHKGDIGACHALVPQMASFHVQKWRRMLPRQLNRTTQRFSKSEPFRLSPRSMMDGGTERYPVPKPFHRDLSFSILRDYFVAQNAVLKALKETIQQHVLPYKGRSIIVMMCNHGQSDLLANFVCSARARKLDTSAILVFCTDLETVQLAQSLGLATFYHEAIFESVPAKASVLLGDATYDRMMITKALCVQLVASLGYDFLFQDVDIVWFKHPLRDYFHLPWSQDYDIIFQDDGQHTEKFGPFHANSGFYFARANALTLAFFDAVLFSGDMILSTSSQQQAVAAVLAEHVSLYGLRAKVIDRTTWELPTGWHFHRAVNYPYMRQTFLPNKDKDLNKNNSSAVIFHMSWTSGKLDKIKYFLQLGEWFVNDTCFNATFTKQQQQQQRKQQQQRQSSNTAKAKVNYSACCLPKAEYKCFFSDKPSLRPCPKYTPKKDGGQSFW
ncbi:hypothetical protein ACA910_012211 [Epithemia clementina (nom. ined.)]